MNEQLPQAEAAVEDMFFETSPDITAFAKAFPKAQKAMGDVLKKATNPAFKTKYADLSAVVEAVLPPLNDNGFSVLQPPGVMKDGKVKVMTLFLHESGQWMRCTLTLTPTKTDPQGAGSAITYGRRYGLQAMSGVAPEDDDGNAASRPTDRSSVRDDAPTGPKAHAAYGAATSTIKEQKTLNDMDAWDKTHEQIMEKLRVDVPAVHAAIVEYARAHRSALAAISSTFGDAADDAAASLERAA